MTHAEKLRINGIKVYGSEKAWHKARAEAGRRGGNAVTERTKLRGFGGDRELAVRGGKLSRRKRS